ncbi:MAG: hypothetical protein ABI743_10920 [bacterium]
MSTTPAERLTLAAIYQPRIPWAIWMVIFGVISLATLVRGTPYVDPISFLPALGPRYEDNVAPNTESEAATPLPEPSGAVGWNRLPNQIPLQFDWEGEPVTWVERTLPSVSLPAMYGLLTGGLLIFLGRRRQPKAAVEVLIPTPLDGFNRHLGDAAAASLMQLTGAYMAYVGMVVQMGVAWVASGALLAGETRTLNNSWVMAGLLVYYLYAGWILLSMNRDSKVAQYGAIALAGGQEYASAPRRSGQQTPRPAPRAARSGSTVD